jgi:hypothetical protein
VEEGDEAEVLQLLVELEVGEVVPIVAGPVHLDARNPAAAKAVIWASAPGSSTLMWPYGMTTSGWSAAAFFAVSRCLKGVRTQAMALRAR